MTDSELLPRQLCQELFEAARQAALRAGVADIEVLLGASESALTRFANNAIHQNVSERSRFVSVRPVIDGRTARANTNRLHRDGIQSVVDEAIALTRASEASTDLLPLFDGKDSSALDHRYSAASAEATPADRAKAVAEAIRVIESAGQSASGIYSTEQSVEALLNSKGLSRYFVETSTAFSVTATAEDSSGWAKIASPVHESVEPVELAKRASRKAALSRSPQAIQPGRYTVILEPAAVLDLVGQIFGDFSGTALEDQRSFLTGRAGEKLFGENISIWDNVACPLQSGAPFDGEGVLRKTLTLVENGVVKDIAWSREAAVRANVEATGHGFPLPNEGGEAPVNIVMAGGETSVEDLIASTENGILVTRLWYIREVEPFQKVMTGMTRDGTFLVKDGEVVHGLRNFRFNQSVVELLNNVDALSRSVRASGEEAFDMVVPGMRVNGFQFTEVTHF